MSNPKTTEKPEAASANQAQAGQPAQPSADLAEGELGEEALKGVAGGMSFSTFGMDYGDQANFGGGKTDPAI